MIAITIVLLYISYWLIRKHQLPESISALAYNAPSGWFMSVMWACAFALAPSLIEHANDSTRFLAFFTVVGIMAVGASPLFRTENTTMHYVGGAVAGIASQTLIAFNAPCCLLPWVAFGIYLTRKDKHYTFWAEIICIITLTLFFLT